MVSLLFKKNCHRLLHLGPANWTSTMTFAQIATLFDIEGVEGCQNTVAYAPPKNPVGCDNTQSSQLPKREEFKGHVIFFPGDIQDFTDKMKQNYQCRDYVDWSYENTINLICNKFPHSHVWLLSPSKKAYNTICVYKNFVKSKSVMGVPSHRQNYFGLNHLELIMKNAINKILPNKPYDQDYLKQECPIIVAGFSKGCIVLNQFLYEVSSFDPCCEIEPNEEETDTLKFDKPNIDFLNRIKMLMWLDGGHSGEEDNWVCDENVIRALLKSPLSKADFHIHVTPYQVRDAHRPWKGESEAEFVRLLKENGLHVEEKLYFEEENPTIDLHFRILLEF
ncbi:mitochondrial protein C2orf69 homolog [Clavelina lepadiformis]|uniref:mitochondrial protein C2orf69 homolog n=1 Tax=Clavelina lepadiformis TaxID=159417 RepID=UPI0040433575